MEISFLPTPGMNFVIYEDGASKVFTVGDNPPIWHTGEEVLYVNGTVDWDGVLPDDLGA